MPEPLQSVNPNQQSQFASPWPMGDRILRVALAFLLGDFLCLDAEAGEPVAFVLAAGFGAKIDGKPFVHQRARIEIPWNLILHDRACLGDRANAYSLGEIEIGARATVAQEVYLSGGTHDFSQSGMPLVTAKITIGEDAFVGARAFVLPGVSIGARSVVGACSVVTKDVPEGSKVAGNQRAKLGYGRHE